MPESVEKPRRKLRRVLRIVAVVAVAVVLLILGVFVLAQVYKAHVRSQIRAELDGLRRAGYPVTLAELNSWYEKRPLTTNAAPVYMEAFAHYYNPPDEYSAWGKLPVLGMGTLGRAEPMSKDMKKVVEEFVAKDKEGLDLLHKAAEIPECRYLVDFTDENLFNWIHHVRDGARRLRLEASLCAENGDGEGAARSVVASLALSRSLKDCPGMVPHLVRIACEQLALGGLERALTRTGIPAEELSLVGQGLAASERDRELVPALVLELCWGTSSYEDPVKAWSIVRWGQDTWYERCQVRLHRSLGLVARDQLWFIRMWPREIEAAKLPLPDRLAAAKSVTEEMQSALRERWPILGAAHLLSTETAQLVHPLVVHDANGIARLRAARVALAVERFRLKTGNLPEQLAELVPAYIEAVPNDPFDGKPLRYKKLDKGYVVYSIGQNLTDDGGSDKWRDDQGPADVTFTVER